MERNRDDGESRVVAQYWDSMAKWYETAYNDSWSQREDAAIGRLVESHLRSVQSTEWVVDLGCGQGLAVMLPNYRLIGVDISAEMIRRLPRSERSVPIRGDFRELPLKSESVCGAVSLFGSLSYTLELSRTLSEISRVLVPGAPFVLMVLSRFSLERLYKLNISRIGLYGSQGAPNGGVPATFYTRSVSSRLEQYGLLVHGIVGQSPWRVPSRRFEGWLWKAGCKLCEVVPELGHSLILLGNKEGA